MLFIFRNFVSIVVSLLQEVSRGVNKGLAKPLRRKVLLAGVFLAVLLFALVSIALANNTAQAPTFKQDWSNMGLITTNNNWGSVPGIIGYSGTALALSAGTDPQTILLDGSLTPVTVLANQTNPNNQNTGGVAEFQLTNPTIALQGDNTASAPHIVINLNTTGRSNINVSYNLRDIDGSTDNATQQVALQYRVGSVGNYTNIPAGYVADATTGPSQATLVTPVSVTLPAAADNQSLVQLRIITSKATTNNKDEWVGVDDIVVTSTPTASSQSVATNAAKTITLTGSDADGDNLTFAIASGPTNGTLGAIGTPTCTGTAPKTCQANVTYTPNASFNGSDSFNFRVNDGSADSADATVSITVNPVNDKPTITHIDDYSIDENTDTGAISFTVGDAETSAGNLEVTGTSSNTTLVPNDSTHVTLGGSGANRTVKVTPAANQFGTTTITLTVEDSDGGTTTTTFTVTVNAVNDPPIAHNDTATTNEDTAVVIDVKGNDAAGPADESNQTLTVTNVTDPPHGTAEIITTGADAGKVRYTPDKDYNGTDSFEYTVCDNGTPSKCDTATVNVNVAAVNDAPVAKNDSYQTNQKKTLKVSAPGVLTNDEDSDNGTGNLSVKLVQKPKNGKLTLKKDGSFTYEPKASFKGNDSFTYKVNDGANDSNIATVTITVKPPSKSSASESEPSGRTITGTSGNDTINSADGKIDSVSCGAGNDTVTADRNDKVSRDCEKVIRR